MKDYSDEQVRGLIRFFPTPLSRIIAVGLIPVVWAVVSLLLANPSILNVESGTKVHLIAAALGGVCSALVLLVVLAVDLSVELNHAKHGRINHYSNLHPFMTWRFILENAAGRHWLAVLTLAALCFGVGFITARLV